ncbi:MAG: efflux RND transporter permease subunit [Pseudomonadota bacterium]
MKNHASDVPRGLLVRLAAPFLKSRLSLIIVIASLCLGAAAILTTPREEEPQIVVPLADVFVQAPGASAEEVEKLVSTPLEKLLWQVDGVEYVYSISRPEAAIVTVRFFVGEDRERSLVKLYNKINMNTDLAPSIVSGWVIKPVEIDDVPIINLTLYSDQYDDHALRRVGEEVLARLAEVEDISQAAAVGGRGREVRVELLPERMSGYNISAMEVYQALAAADSSVQAGGYSQANNRYAISSDSFLSSAREVGDLVVGVHVPGGASGSHPEEGRPVYLRDIAAVLDGPEEPYNHSRIGFSRYYLNQAGRGDGPASMPAVTLALSKKKGVNAVAVSENILARLDELKKTVIPDGIEVEVTRNQGQTAQSKVDELLSSLAFAILTVVILLAFTLGWREAMIVALAVPISFSLALFINYLFGYTINRVTLFALILSLGLVVDDPITNVDNIQRHIRLGRLDPVQATLHAINEVLPPVIMSTLAIIISFAPLFFISGMMGPYMAPMAANVPLTVTFSTFCALTIVPWSAYHLLKNKAPAAGAVGAAAASDNVTPAWVQKGYRLVLGPFLDSRALRWLLLVLVAILLVFSVGLAVFRHIPLKMLPFDNKNEFQIVLDLPEGATLEQTDGVARAFEAYLENVPEVTNFVSYVGRPSPKDFNGMVRHYYLRESPNLADIRVNLADKTKRVQQSHAILLRLRSDLTALAEKNGAKVKLVESPPGPPVFSTIAAEIYGPPDFTYQRLLEGALHVEETAASEPFVVDVDSTRETTHAKFNFVIDKEKAALHGVSADRVTETLRMAVSGLTPAAVHLVGERQSLPVRVTIPLAKRSSLVTLSQLPVKSSSGHPLPLAELGHFEELTVDQPIYHKNLKRVVYIYGEMAGRAPGEAVLDIQSRLRDDPPPAGIEVNWAGEGEWKITLDVFRDLGLAFGAALLGIYILLIIETASYFLPLVIMLAIPLTLLGIMPGFWLLNLISNQTVGGFPDPVFFTATSMIGMIALGGIVIRNSLVLIDFINKSHADGQPLKEAILDSGAVRLRPILLTALTTALGAWPITLDPIFSGLAWALIFGLLASTAFTLVIIPVVYWSLYRKKFEAAV